MKKRALGIDIGGSGVKGALVHLKKGDFSSDRLRIATPQPATPEAVAEVVGQIVSNFEPTLRTGPVGVTLPAVVTHGISRSAANIDPKWVDCNAQELFASVLGRPVTLVNDADAAGVAEAAFGAAKGVRGVVIMTTLGTGIGTAIVHDGKLLPNTELGHIELDGADVELSTSSAAKTRENLSYQEYAERLQRYYRAIEDLFWPDLFVVGGGISKDHEKFLPLLQLRTPIVPATLRNKAGIIGAAMYAAQNR